MQNVVLRDEEPPVPQSYAVLACVPPSVVPVPQCASDHLLPLLKHCHGMRCAANFFFSSKDSTAEVVLCVMKCVFLLAGQMPTFKLA